MSRLSDEQIAKALEGGRWRLQDDAIVRDLELEDFAAAMACANRVAELAEAANHHPDILIHGWNRVRLTLSTHSEGAVTQADLDMAGQIDRVC
jgi:4a-hydroxytetrahydrobiopterin dehydratase